MALDGFNPCGRGPLLCGHHVFLLSITASLFHASSFAQGSHSSFQCIRTHRVLSIHQSPCLLVSFLSITFQFLSCLASSPLPIWHSPVLDKPSHAFCACSLAAEQMCLGENILKAGDSVAINSWPCTLSRASAACESLA